MDLNKHLLVPRHTKLSDPDKKKLFDKYSITAKEAPKILKDDPAIRQLNPKIGDMIMIERSSKTAGLAVHYRIVIDV